MGKRICYAENADVFPGIIARNNAVLEYEKFIHRTFYPYIIHPYSLFRITWEIIFVFLIPLRVTVVSVLWVVLPRKSLLFQILHLLFQFFNMLDVVLTFFTGYVESETEIAVLDPRRIARMYLMTYFVVDVIPCIPLEFLFFSMDDSCFQEQEFRHFKPCYAVIDLFLLSLGLRLFCFVRYCRNLTKIKLLNSFLMGIVSIIFTIYSAVLLANDFYILLGATDIWSPRILHEKDDFLSTNNSVQDKFAEFFDSLSSLALDCLYYDSKKPITNVYIRDLLLVIFFFASILFMAYFINYVMLKMKPKEKFLDLESRVFSFLRKRHLPLALGNKTLLYFQILLQNKYYREDEILNYIPDTFKADIFFQLCLPLLKNFYAFEDLPTYVLRRLAECMKYQLYLPNELVMKKDEQRKSMYFVQRGTVALYSVKHVELYHFETGNSFNGRNLISEEYTTNTYAISIEVAEIYRLDRTDFFEIMRTYPKLLKKVTEKFREDKRGSTCLLD